MYIASVRSQNDNFEIAWARANRNPKRMMKEIFKGITSLGLKRKKYKEVRTSTTKMQMLLPCCVL